MAQSQMGGDLEESPPNPVHGPQLPPSSRTNLRVVQVKHEHARLLLGKWEAVLERSVDEIIEVMLDPGVHTQDLRQVTPFAGVLLPSERARVYAEFRPEEHRV